jgi:hypothetical protein
MELADRTPKGKISFALRQKKAGDSLKQNAAFSRAVPQDPEHP